MHLPGSPQGPLSVLLNRRKRVGRMTHIAHFAQLSPMTKLYGNEDVMNLVSTGNTTYRANTTGPIQSAFKDLWVTSLT